MSFSLASIADPLTEGCWKTGDPINKSDQALICSSIVQRGEEDRDRNQNQNPTWDQKRMTEE